MEEKRDVTEEAGDEKQTRDFLQSEAIGEKGTDQNSKKRSITAGATADQNHPPLIAKKKRLYHLVPGDTKIYQREKDYRPIFDCKKRR